MHGGGGGSQTRRSVQVGGTILYIGRIKSQTQGIDNILQLDRAINSNRNVCLGILRKQLHEEELLGGISFFFKEGAAAASGDDNANGHGSTFDRYATSAPTVRDPCILD